MSCHACGVIRITKIIAISGIILSAFSLLFRSILSEQDPDLPWHIRMGLDVLEGRSWFIDHHSHTHFGEKVKSSYLLFQIFIAFVYSNFGYFGIVAAKIFLVSLGAWALDYALKKCNVNDLHRAVSFVFYCFAASSRFFLRADNIMYALVPLQFLFLYRLSQKWSLRTLGLYVISFLLWINWHTFSSALGFVLLGAFCLEQLIFKFNSKKTLKWSQLAILGAVFVLVGFANPFLDHPLSQYFRYDSNKWNGLVAEMSSRNAMEFTWVFWLFSFLFVVSVGASFLRKNFLVWHGVFVFVLLKSAFTFVRMVLIAPALASFSFGFVSDQAFPKSPVWKLILATFALLVSFQSVSSSLGSFRGASDFEGFDVTSSASGVWKQFSSANSIGGRALNDPNLGGYLMLYLPEVLVSNDTRSEYLYRPEDLTNYYSMWSSRSMFQSYIESKAIDFVAGPIKYNSADLFRWLVEDKRWMPLAFDDFFYFYSRKQGAKSLTDFFWNPNCFEKLKASDLRRDQSELSNVLVSGSEMLRTLEFLALLSEGNEPSFVAPTDTAKRGYVVFLMKHKKLDEAEIVLRSIRNSNMNDALTLVAILMEKNESDEAVSLIAGLGSLSSPSPVRKEVLSDLKRHFKLQMPRGFDPSYFEKLEAFSARQICN